MECPTVRIKSDVSEYNPHGYVVVNEADFDKTTMQLFQEPFAPATSSKKSAAPVSAPANGAPWAAK